MQNDIVKQPAPAKPVAMSAQPEVAPTPQPAVASVPDATTSPPVVPKESQTSAEDIKKLHDTEPSQEENQNPEPQISKVSGPPSAAGPITLAVIVCMVLIATAVYVQM